ncbi:MAG: hypothetical protein ACI88A_000886 [Paraglaciecola sp.]|jgi:hypothetical protein
MQDYFKERDMSVNEVYAAPEADLISDEEHANNLASRG